ncbi:MAG: cell division protein FtsA [Deltaproteobacteria bacterium]
MQGLFALDIGTRKVMGLLCRRTDDGLEMTDMEVIEHSTRCMLDGQIHSIEDVARTVMRIRERLEKRLGSALSEVGLAVAGRNLTTYKGTVSREYPVPEEITPALLKDIELEAVDSIASGAGVALSDFYCVGYSPVFYEIDGNRISDPAGHRARSMRAQIIATFLPRIVLDSIRAVLDKAGLKATNITLEPIAAINAIVPPELRNLNIILVDIGAGTSDLALARDGQVFAYGMVAEAGDEITEFISGHLLCDFANAEKIKRLVETSAKGGIDYVDIWNRPRQIEAGALKALILPAVKKLAGSIARTAMELNGGAPQAVVLVGGGALTPDLIPELASAFGLPQYKVGIRLPSLIGGVADRTGKLGGSEAVTPIGIALMTEKAQGLRFIDVEVNGRVVSLLDFEQKKDVLGALTLSGQLSGQKLHARPGLALVFSVNGQTKIVKGTFGEPAKITRNGAPVSSLSEKIENGDRIDFEGAVDGVDASARIKDIVEARPVQAFVNGQGLDLWPQVLVDSVPAALISPVKDRAVIEVRAPAVSQALEMAGVKVENLSQRQVLVNINGVPKILPQRNFAVRLNGSVCDLDTPLSPGDRVDFSSEVMTYYRISDLVDVPRDVERLSVDVDGRAVELTVRSCQVYMNGQQVDPNEFIIDGADIRVMRAGDRGVMLSEIFKYVDVDARKIRGKRLRIFVNDVPAGFTTLLTEGSRVRIVFEER